VYISNKRKLKFFLSFGTTLLPLCLLSSMWCQNRELHGNCLVILIKEVSVSQS